MLDLQKITCIRGERLVFDDLTLSISPGSILVLTGPNGSGKSSLLRIMAGFLAPASGSMSWQDEAISDDPAAHRRRTAYLGHSDAVKPALTVRENLAVWPFRQPEAKILEAMEAFNLTHLADVAGRFLSSGQKRRTALARLLLKPASLWLLDEPAVGLDGTSIARMIHTIETYRKGGGIVVVITHQPLSLSQPTNLNMADYAVEWSEAMV